MAGQVLRRRRLVNPRRRRMTAKQIKFFGTPRQKAALRNKRRGNRGRPNRGPRRRRNQTGIVSQAQHAASSAIRSVERAAEDAIQSVSGAVNRGRRRANVGEILTVIPANPGRRRRRRKNMAARARNRRRASNRGVRRHNRRRRSNPRRRVNVHRRHRRRTNPKVIVRYRNRRHHRRNRGRRRNPDFLRGDIGAVVGVLGGAAVTSIVTGFLPSNFTTGYMGYIATGVVAAVQGQVIGKVMKNSKLGNWMTVGGLVIVALKVASDMGFHIPGLSGMGLITSSNFFVPQVNQPGSMATFVTPAGIPSPVVVQSGAKLSGLGQQFSPGLRTMRRVGRLR